MSVPNEKHDEPDVLTFTTCTAPELAVSAVYFKREPRSLSPGLVKRENFRGRSCSKTERFPRRIRFSGVEGRVRSGWANRPARGVGRTIIVPGTPVQSSEFGQRTTALFSEPSHSEVVASGDTRKVRNAIVRVERFKTKRSRR